MQVCIFGTGHVGLVTRACLVEIGHRVMGLAPYGESRYVDVILDELIDLKADGSIKLSRR